MRKLFENNPHSPTPKSTLYFKVNAEIAFLQGLTELFICKPGRNQCIMDWEA
jgi:hypothetical protein